MKRNINKWSAVAAGVLASAGLCPLAPAQSADALIDKLVDKGILTVKEANDLREETDKGFTQAYQVKSGMPDWVTSFKLNGDFRGRYESISPNGTSVAGSTLDKYLVDRNRFRYRLRLGAVATLRDQFEVGLRLTSSDAAKGGVGGDPISGNTTFTSNGSKKFVYLDLAYGKWTPVINGDFTTAFTVGKMENPFLTSEMVFDPDYTPEGFAQQLGYNLSKNHALKLNLGEFAILEDSAKSRDPFLFGAQLRWDATWTPKLLSSLGLGGYALTDADRLVTASVPDQNAGNQRAGGKLQSAYNPVVVDAALTYNLSSFPLYTGAFPIKVAGEYMNNTAVSAAGEGYWAGIYFGKSGKKGTWDISYRWKELQGDAWWEELVDSDFGAFYSGVNAKLPRSGGIGYSAGTNVRGHVIKATYSPTDALTLGVAYQLTEVMDEPKGRSEPTSRLQVDASLKF